MSKIVCKDCKYYNPLSSLCVVKGGKVSASAVGCPANYIKPPTVFQEITASPEVLAEKLVYYDSKFHVFCSNLDRLAIGYQSETEAISATVEKLNEVGE